VRRHAPSAAPGVRRLLENARYRVRLQRCFPFHRLTRVEILSFRLNLATGTYWYFVVSCTLSSPFNKNAQNRQKLSQTVFVRNMHHKTWLIGLADVPAPTVSVFQDHGAVLAMHPPPCSSPVGPPSRMPVQLLIHQGPRTEMDGVL
jgi:hypothetical protein